jgi:hypothetical protein
MKYTNVIIILMAIAILWLLYKDFIVNKSIENFDSSTAGVIMSSSGIIFNKPIIFNESVTYKKPVATKNLVEYKCADENGKCTIGEGGYVFYSADNHRTGGKQTFRIFNKGQVVDCNNGTFGDPVYGVGKSCYTFKYAD